MAKMTIASAKNAVCEYEGGRVQASIVALPRNRWSFTIKTNTLSGVSRETLVEYADAVRKVCKHVGKVIGKDVSLSGKNIDFDEPTLTPNEDATVTGQIFPKDKRIRIMFTRYAENGEVRAGLQSFVWTDIPSAIQVAHVAIKTANLMKRYLKED